MDRAAARLLPAISRSELASWIRAGELTLDGKRVKPGAAVRGGERLRASIDRQPRLDWQAAEQLPFDIVHQDDDLLVVDKPPGLVVHPGAGQPRGTLVNGLLHRRPALAMLPRAGLVHRLDKDTSGLMMVAANPESLLELGRALRERLVERRYLAVVEGAVTGARTIDLPIGRDPRHRTRQAVRDDGRPAVTRIAPRERFAAHTLVEAKLETGRTHQVRVHLAAIGHALVGDARYGASGRLPPHASAEAAAAIRGFPRQALHAFRLSFGHPRTGRRLEFESSPPGDIEALLGALRGDARGDH